MRSPRPWGATLTELILGFGLFTFFMGGLFALFTRGYQAFHFLSARQGVQGEALRLKSVLQADLANTHFRSIGVEARQTTLEGQSLPRDQVCCLSLRDWQDPASYADDLGLPLWDRYVLYQTSLEQTTLTRLTVEPPDPIPYRLRPLAGFGGITNENVVARSLLSSQVRSFRCQLDRALQEVSVTFVLQSQGGQRGLDASTRNDTLEAQLRWTPSNTVPRL